MAELEADLASPNWLDEVDDLRPGRLLLVVQSPVQPSVMRASGETQVISVNISARATGRRGAVMHEVPVARHALHGRVHVHGRDHDPVLDRHVPQRKGWNMGTGG